MQLSGIRLHTYVVTTICCLSSTLDSDVLHAFNAQVRIVQGLRYKMCILITIVVKLSRNHQYFNINKTGHAT